MRRLTDSNLIRPIITITKTPMLRGAVPSLMIRVLQIHRMTRETQVRGGPHLTIKITFLGKVVVVGLLLRQARISLMVNIMLRKLLL